MKTIGLIGGMSWKSSAEYYKIINEEIRNRLGKLHSAKIIMYSVDFYEIEKLQRNGYWDKASDIICKVAINLDKIDADFIVICSITGHEGVERIQKHINIPILHIADVINERIRDMNVVGLLGTKYTMEMDYFKSRLNSKIIIPSEEDREFINNVIYHELTKGIILRTSKNKFQAIIHKLQSCNVEGIILGCTEIPLLIKQENNSLPIFDTTLLHSIATVNFALRGDYK